MARAGMHLLELQATATCPARPLTELMLEPIKYTYISIVISDAQRSLGMMLYNMWVQSYAIKVKFCKRLGVIPSEFVASLIRSV
eukprot:450846-Amphidinium_carterae.2